MALPDELPQPPPVEPPPKADDERLALRRITQRLKQLRAELERINHPESGSGS